MNSRIKQQERVNHLFDCFLELRPLSSPTLSTSQPNGSSIHSDQSSTLLSSILQAQNGVQSNEPSIASLSSPSSSPPHHTSGPEVSAVIIKKYPASYCEEEFLRSVGHFCFPCPQLQHDTITHFSFVLTSMESSWTFGFCRHLPPPERTCLLLLSSLPWHDTFFKLLNHLAALTHSQDLRQLQQFLRTLYYSPVPRPGQELLLQYNLNSRQCEYRLKCTESHKIASIPEDRNLTEYYNALDAANICQVFAAMLHERRIMIKSTRLQRLTGSVQAANSLLYPMQWQHIFIPILPKQLIEYLNAPMPFLIGVPAALVENHRASELDELVVVDADHNLVTTPYDDLNSLPLEVISFLKKNLKSGSYLLGDRIARVFLRALVMMLGGYRDALRLLPGQQITFHDEQFVLSRPPTMQPFLRQLLRLQSFRQFVEQRLALLNAGEGLNDEFEHELNAYEFKSAPKFKHQYRQWLGNFKRESGAMFRSVHPAVRSAYRQLKDRSKKAYKEIRHKIGDHHHHLSHQNGTGASRASSLNLVGAVPEGQTKSHLHLNLVGMSTRSCSLDFLNSNDCDLMPFRG